MPWTAIALLVLIFASKLIHTLLTSRENAISDEQMELNRKNELKALIEEREERVDLTMLNEEEFWEMMEEIKNRSKSNFKNSMGVFKDLIKKYTPEELIQLDNLLVQIFKENLNYDIYAASRIIFKTNDLGATLLLMNMLMARGQVFFSQACHNPNLIIGKEFNEINGRVFQDVVAEVYGEKTLKLIPELIINEDEKIEIHGEKWTEKELPSRYEELWYEYS